MKGLLYVLTSVWVLHTLKAGQNILFPCICRKKAERGRKSMKIEAEFSKKTCFSNAGREFYSQKKNLFSNAEHFDRFLESIMKILDFSQSRQKETLKIIVFFT